MSYSDTTSAIVVIFVVSTIEGRDRNSLYAGALGMPANCTYAATMTVSWNEGCSR